MITAIKQILCVRPRVIGFARDVSGKLIATVLHCIGVELIRRRV